MRRSPLRSDGVGSHDWCSCLRSDRSVQVMIDAAVRLPIYSSERRLMCTVQLFRGFLYLLYSAYDAVVVRFMWLSHGLRSARMLKLQVDLRLLSGRALAWLTRGFACRCCTQKRSRFFDGMLLIAGLMVIVASRRCGMFVYCVVVATVLLTDVLFTD
jgi:hypothetical protein